MSCKTSSCRAAGNTVSVWCRTSSCSAETTVELRIRSEWPTNVMHLTRFYLTLFQCRASCYLKNVVSVVGCWLDGVVFSRKDVIQCLSSTVRDDTLSNHKQRISARCRSQLTFEKLQRVCCCSTVCCFFLLCCICDNSHLFMHCVSKLFAIFCLNIHFVPVWQIVFTKIRTLLWTHWS